MSKILGGRWQTRQGHMKPQPEIDSTDAAHHCANMSLRSSYGQCVRPYHARAENCNKRVWLR
jgi:hypothetical protein